MSPQEIAEQIQPVSPEPTYYPRWIIVLDEDLDHTPLGLAQTPEQQDQLILDEMDVNDDLRSAGGDATCFWLYIPTAFGKPKVPCVHDEPHAADDEMPRMEGFSNGYMDELRQKAGRVRTYLIKVEYQVEARTTEEARAIAIASNLERAALKAVDGYDEQKDHLAMLDAVDDLRKAVGECREILRTDVRRPGEIGDW
jgi:hypothetical protein